MSGRLLRHSPRRVAMALVLLLVVFLISLVRQEMVLAQNRKEAERKGKTVAKRDPYGRPQVSKPVKPIIPGVNRNQTDKVFLEYADSLYRVPMGFSDRERQILKGSVKFRQAGMWMFCDSAYYFPEENALDAFGHVKMEQGDTLFVFADRLYYDGNQRMARLRCGETQSQVKMENRDVVLLTDSFDYDLGQELGWYATGGRLIDGTNTLTSLYGEYSPATKRAEFFHDVVLVNDKDGYRLLSDTLYYNTETHIADIVSRTIIEGKNDTIITTEGNYNTETDYAELTSRSTIMHTDSNRNVVTLTGDSIIYDRKTRISRAYKFSDPRRNSQPMVLTDTARKSILIGGFGLYNDSTREAMATDYPLLMEFSRPDTLFLRADTILTYITTDTVRPQLPGQKKSESEAAPPPPPSAQLSGAMARLQGHTAQQLPAIPDNKPLPGMEQDSIHQDERERLTESTTDSFPTIRRDSIEPGGVDLPSLSQEVSHEVNDSLPRSDKEPLPESDIQSLNTGESNSLLAEVDSVTPPSNPDDMTATEPKKEFHIALAYPRARFFNQDVQGVADTIRFMELDSMLYLTKNPVVWNGERQVTGNRIDVHFNDSTADWALLPDWGMMTEHVDEDFYNQLSGRVMKALFDDGKLTHLDVSKNVQSIFLPMENDSTYNKLVTAEGGYLSVDVDNNQLQRLKMWPDVSGTVTPTFMVKNVDKYLQYFQWLEAIRPRREWYGDRLHWADDLGEVPPELDIYLKKESVFPASQGDD